MRPSGGGYVSGDHQGALDAECRELTEDGLCLLADLIAHDDRTCEAVIHRNVDRKLAWRKVSHGKHWRVFAYPGGLADPREHCVRCLRCAEGCGDTVGGELLGLGCFEERNLTLLRRSDDGAGEHVRGVDLG